MYEGVECTVWIVPKLKEPEILCIIIIVSFSFDAVCAIFFVSFS